MNYWSGRQAKSRVLGMFALLLLGSVARAVPTAVNLALVVNSASPASLTIANQYIATRHIPANNIIYIDLPAKYIESIDVNDFRKLLLEPVCNAIRDRKLNGQIDVVAWSADFPHAVRVNADIGNDKPPKYITPVASINGLTYLYTLALKKDPAYLSLNSNRYAPAVHHVKPGDDIKFVEPRPFHRTLGWANDGTPLVNEPDKGYLLSTVLGITAGRGNTVNEVRDMIRRSAAADGTWPSGTIYYLVNNDIRSKARQWGFKLAADRLINMGINAEVIDGVLPKEKEDVAGAMIGIADFNWPASQSRILPGAVAEHLTSTGGVMFKGAGQTPISEFIRAGASGTSGTVTEPYAIQEKFPSPFIHVYYASGCSLAEAFYQSVSGPYQLLIIGDPLCRPWGLIPKVSIDLAANTKAKGVLTLKPSCESTKFPVSRFDLYLDGRWVAGELPGKEMTLDSATHPDGWHELRIIATLADPVESKGETIIPLLFDNHGHTVEVARTNQGLRATATGATKLTLLSAGQELATIDGPAGTFALDKAKIGDGPASLHVSATFADEVILSPPLELDPLMRNQ